MPAKQPTIDANELKSIFEQEYNRNQWVRVLREIFAVSNLFASPKYLNIEDDKLGAKVYELGHFETKEGKLVGIYEVPITNKSVKLERNKVGLRNLLKKVYREDVDAAFIVFNQGQKWRFSYVSEIRVTDPVTKKRVHKKTDPKRYTYIMGVGERCKTAADRFSRIYKTEDLFEAGIELDTIEEAFSVERLSKSFFDGYKNLYGQFVAYLTGKDESGKQVYHPKHGFLKSIFKGGEKAARDFVKKMMGRIVFLYFLEKKGWLGVAADGNWGDGLENFMSDIFNDCVYQEDFYAQVLVPLFFDTLNSERTNDLFKIKSSVFKKGDYAKRKIPFLNGGLFDAEAEETQMLVFKKEHFKELFDFFDQYNFTVYEDSPEEHTVAVDPEMLGHIFENLLEDNKDKGAFYTPKEIVHYMCQESLIEYLYTKLNPEGGKRLVTRESIEKFIKHREAAEIVDYDEAILQELYDVKICDPAIGSGAFPMGLLHEIFYAIELLYDISPDATTKIWKLKKWEPAKIKLSIIENSIYGVDLEQGAVDIARLRFWLSLVVDEEKPQPLPNLDYKIVVGDSLLPKLKIDGEEEIIDVDWSYSEGKKAANLQIQDELRAKQVLLKEKQHQYFNVKVHKNALHKDIEALKADILIKQLTISKTSYIENTPQKGGYAPTAKEILHNQVRSITIAKFDNLLGKLKELKASKNNVCFFDWKFNFPEITLEGVSKSAVGFDIVIGNPPYITIRNQDDITKKYIKDGYTHSKGADIYVAFLERGLNILRRGGNLVYIIPNKFFGADYGKAIRTHLKNGPIGINLIWDLKDQKVFENALISTIVFSVVNRITDVPTKLLQNGEENFVTNLFDSSGKIQIEANESDNIVLNKINRGKKLNELANVRTGIMGFEYWKMEAIIRDRGSVNSKNAPIYTNGNFDRYQDSWATKEIKLYKDNYVAPTIQLSREYLSENTISLFKASPKILVRGVSQKVAAIIDNVGSALLVAVHSVIPKNIDDIFWITAIINSKLANWYHLKTIYSIRIPQGSLKYPVSFFENFPIATPANPKRMSGLAKELIAGYNAASGKNEDTERKINILTYKTYGLNYDEACLIEGNRDWITESEYINYVTE